MDFPMDTGVGGIVAQVLMKYICGQAWQAEKVDNTTRGCFIAADEAQFYLAASDSDLLSTSRSARISVCYATQDLPTYYAKLGGSRDVAESILSKFGCRIYHANLSRETNLAAAEQVGRIQKFSVSESRSRAASSGAGGQRHDQNHGGFSGNHGASTTSGQSTSAYMDYDISPDYFSSGLRTGGKINGYKVDAIVVRNAKKWKATGRHWVKAEFSQR
jgi:hypothetical protein